MKSIIITGANSGIGFECTMQMARIAPDKRIILACRNENSGNEAVKKIKRKTGHQDLVCIGLDLASLDSIRGFVDAFTKFDESVISALVNNAGGLFVGDTQYTKDGFELTFGTNHIGGFYLTMLLAQYIEQNGSITFVSSGVHDPANHTGIQVPVYTSGKDLAYPKETVEKKMHVAQRRYSTSKLCNVLTAYVLHEKLTDIDIRVNVFDPGQVLGTGFLRTLPVPMRLIAKYIMPYFVKKNNTPELSGGRLANLAYAKELQSLSGIYYSGGEVKKSSIDSYDTDIQRELWESSVELCGLDSNRAHIGLINLT